MKLAIASALTLALLAPIPHAAHADDYPSRTVTVVVPFPAGGSVDGVARILVQKLNETMGQHFIVENHAGGASGIRNIPSAPLRSAPPATSPSNCSSSTLDSTHWSSPIRAPLRRSPIS